MHVGVAVAMPCILLWQICSRNDIIKNNIWDKAENCGDAI